MSDNQKSDMVKKETATKTYPPLVRGVFHQIGHGNVMHHEPTKNNPLGQSGLHTLIMDIMDIMETAPNTRQAWKDLHTFFTEGEL